MDRLVRLRGAHVARSVRRTALGFLASAAAVAAVTGLIYLLRPHVPALSLSVLYVLAILPIAVVWGRVHAALVAVASMLLFNFLFLPPVHTLTLGAKENWLKLLVFLVTGLLVAELAARARQRARDAEQREREAVLLAELSTVLLSGAEVESELVRIADGASRILRTPSARIELGPPQRVPGEAAIELRAGDRCVGALYVPAWSSIDNRVAERFLPPLASLLGVAVDRERLQREAFEAEALRRSDSMKTALLRAVSHDLRSPLTAIRVAVESLESPSLVLGARERAALLETVRFETERLDRLVGNLLDLSRLQAGAPRTTKSLRSVDDIVVQALEGLADHERVAVSLPDHLPLVEVDETQIERVLANVLENAIRFSPPGTPVSIGAGVADGEVLIRVEDEGPGVPHHELERVFEPFRHASTAGDSKGTGLGLAIARGFAEANGGRLVVEPRAGGGASFVLALPAAVYPAAIPV